MLIDCCPLWDNDGQAYFVAAEPRWYLNWTLCDYKMHLFKMSHDGERIIDSGTVVHGGRITEAVKLYKINGYYYMFYREHPIDENGRGTQFAARSRNIYGPYERRKLIHSHEPVRDLEPSQGGLVETSDGKWYFLCHGMNQQAPEATYIGRPLMLLPVEWIDGWPIIGDDIDNDGVGEMVWSAAKPVSGYGPYLPQSSDEFDGEKMGLQWQWNHVPRNDSWSLTERKGYMRLKACHPIYPGGFFKACNTLTQRIIGEHSYATTVLDVAGMADGQYAGLCFFTTISHLLGIYKEGGKTFIRYHYSKMPVEENQDGMMIRYFNDYLTEDIAEFVQNEIWLGADMHINRAQLLYSLNGVDFMPVGEPFTFGFFAWRGGRVGLFCWNDFKEEGYADFDWFRYTLDGQNAVSTFKDAE